MSNLPFRYYLITDRTQCAPRPLPEVVEEACQNGIRAIQLREKDLSAKELYRLAKKLRETTSRYGARLFINDRADIALAVEADGVHCRETSMRPGDIKQFNSSLVVGASVHSIDSALKAETDGADFLLFGPVFYTASKAKYGDPQGLEKLKKVVSNVRIPLYAVGGITPARAVQCLEAGAHGVAGISSIMTADSIPQKIEEWKTRLQHL
ncbi:thiamine phosphate synthase [Aliifodinibius sp. S!AR15-10]|uniref:thiamine phosphate synthase n=1 Tax=Aliifodinibius sp. S!AR15-10 TaxID=2950437 RepID=UPI002861D283|nr:thiamine phosphate synthase [Aliifodinibius sp. S!AR15-10]MDR8393681.1 thiamine phosphate synthase [Aliifodinibius sp. S!AR15-10]